MSMYTAGHGEGNVPQGDSDVSDEWLTKARDAFNTSDDWFDASIRKDTERNLAHFASRHAPNSKYHTDSYKYRARGFRPKTRSLVRNNEAAAANALFSTSDAVHVSAENDADEIQKVSAEINQELLNYRLENTIPWFQTALGAYQDTLVTGVCISHQTWDYRESKQKEPMTDGTGAEVLDMDGEPAYSDDFEVIKDTPVIELRPIENVRFAPSADWHDPVNTSPYIIDRIPMTIGEVKARMKDQGKSQIPWIEVDDGIIQQALTDAYDPIRNQREAKRQDSKDQRHVQTDFDTVWVHRNIIREDNEDVIFYTLGVYHRLSDPIPLREEYPHLSIGQRPYVLGVSSVETHKAYPEGVVSLSANLQQEANDINNQRRDNVALVLNRRYIVRRGAQVDYKSLMNNVAGSITLTDDINQDIRVEAPPEVTASSYQEQDRVNMDFDELTGSFSTSSVGSNRQLNETVGGMEMLSTNANTLTEYQLRVFVETWVQPVLKQIIQLEQYYETDESLLSLMGEKIKLWQRYGVNNVTDKLLAGTMSVEVNVGFGATNPKQRIEKLAMGLNTVLQFSPVMAQKLSGDEIAAEVFGALGFKGVERFFPEPEQDAQQEGQPSPEQMPKRNKTRRLNKKLNRRNYKPQCRLNRCAKSLKCRNNNKNTH